MPGILDIAPPESVTETFEIRGGKLQVRALRERELAALRFRFPKMQATEEEERVMAALDARPAAIAAAAGQVGNEEIEAEIADRLTDAEQSEVFAAIMRLTNPPVPLAESPVVAGQASGGSTRIMPQRLNS